MIFKRSRSTLIPLGIVIFSSVIYTYVALLISRFFRRGLLPILLTFVISVLIWFCIAAPFAMYRITNLYAGITGYLILIVLAHVIMNRHRPEEELVKPRYSKTQILLRAMFMGSVIAMVVVMGKLVNSFWGGIFAMFPAATLVSLFTFHFYYAPEQLFYL